MPEGTTFNQKVTGGSGVQANQIAGDNASVSQNNEISGMAITAAQFLEAVVRADSEPHARPIPETNGGLAGTDSATPPAAPSAEMLFGKKSPIYEAATAYDNDNAETAPLPSEDVQKTWWSKAQEFGPTICRACKAFGRGAVETLTSNNPVIAGLVSAADVVFEDR